ncbi:GNAT family N-acetyltransferase [Peribacillus sp. NPDC097675]|uniref:GNAT family N-acetyltransferase n=1 Tax=Peribacillus sp. NPDC097675 TaxID=3390618 RepID=UPI003CFC7D49
MFIHKIDKEVSLKILESKDAKAIFKLTNHSRNYLREWLPWLDRTTKIEDTQAYIQHCLNGFSGNTSMTTVILYKGEIAGIAGYNQLNWANKTAYIGYWLGEEFQGRGVMTKVAKALTEYAFNELQLNKVEIRVAVKNKKSRGIPERLGYVNEGCLRQAEWLYDHYVDHIVYGMLAAEWKQEER